MSEPQKSEPEVAEQKEIEHEVEEPQYKIRVEINYAPRDELMKVPGIGVALAQRIVNFRETFGNLGLEELKRIKNIKVTEDMVEGFNFVENPNMPTHPHRLELEDENTKSEFPGGATGTTEKDHQGPDYFEGGRDGYEHEQRDQYEKPYPQGYKFRGPPTFEDTLRRVEKVITPHQKKAPYSMGGARPKLRQRSRKPSPMYRRERDQYYNEDSGSESEYEYEPYGYAYEYESRRGGSHKSRHFPMQYRKRREQGDMGMGSMAMNPFMMNPFMNPYMMTPMNPYMMNPYMMDPSDYAGPHYYGDREPTRGPPRRVVQRGGRRYNRGEGEVEQREEQRGQREEQRGQRDEQREQRRPQRQNPQPDPQPERAPSPERNDRVEEGEIESDPADDERSDDENNHNAEGAQQQDFNRRAGRRVNRNIRQNRQNERYDREIPKSLQYDGRENWDAFNVKFRRYAEVHNWTPRNCKDQLCFCLKGKASEFFATVTQKDADLTFEEIMTKLHKRFGIKEIPETARVKFNSLKQVNDESIEDWADRVLQLSIHAFPDLPDEYVNSQVIQRICHGAYDRDAGQFAANQPQVSVEATLDKIKSYQYNHKAIFERNHPNKMAKEVRQVSTAHSSSSDETSERDSSPIMVRETARVNSRQSRPQNGGYTQGKNTSGYINYKEKFASLESEIGHIRSDMRGMFDKMERLFGQRSRGTESRSPSRTPSPSTRGCFRCGSENHFKKDCPGLFGQNKSAPGQGPGNRKVHFEERSQSPNWKGSSEKA